jgi:1-acyl-sn-glycerol-3-phosphate acyltransferase
MMALSCFLVLQVAGRKSQLRPVFKRIGPVVFVLALVQAICVQFVFCYLILAPFKIWPAPIQKKVNQICRIAKGLLWPWAFQCAPWIQVEVENGHLWDQIQQPDKRDKRPTILLSNHTSFLDAILLTCLAPWRLVHLHVVLMKASLLKIPLLGSILVSEGHLPVHREKESDGAKVSKDKSHILTKQMEETLDERQILFLFPEGTQNKGDCSKLQPFRYGSFKLAIQKDAAVWGWVALGNNESWPASAAIGGLPASIRSSVIELAPEGALAHLKRLGVPLQVKEGQTADQLLQEQCEALTQAMQQTMQQELDRLGAARDVKMMHREPDLDAKKVA